MQELSFPVCDSGKPSSSSSCSSSSHGIFFTPHPFDSLQLRRCKCSMGCQHLHVVLIKTGLAKLLFTRRLQCFLHYTLLQQSKNDQPYICLLFWHSPEASAAAHRWTGRCKLGDRVFCTGKLGQWWSISAFYMIFMEVVNLSSHVFKPIHLQVKWFCPLGHCCEQ